MARADYQAQLERHAGEWDVLPHGLVVPSLPHGSDWHDGHCRGVALLSDTVLAGNRWPAVSGALLAELAVRCATLGALTCTAPNRRLRAREIKVDFRKAIPVADPRGRPHVGDGNTVLYWTAEVDPATPGPRVEVSMTRRVGAGADTILAVTSRVCFDTVPMPGGVGRHGVEYRMSDYLLGLPRRLALPAYHLGWSREEIRGDCREMPGSLVAVAEQALGDAGKIVRGDDTPAGEDESMLLASMSYSWIRDVDDGLVDYVACSGARRTDDRGRDWVDAAATLTIAGEPVGEARGTLVFRKYRMGS